MYLNRRGSTYRASIPIPLDTLLTGIEPREKAQVNSAQLHICKVPKKDY
jgi:hypothetical protein